MNFNWRVGSWLVMVLFFGGLVAACGGDRPLEKHPKVSAESDPAVPAFFGEVELPEEALADGEAASPEVPASEGQPRVPGAVSVLVSTGDLPRSWPVGRLPPEDSSDSNPELWCGTGRVGLGWGRGHSPSRVELPGNVPRPGAGAWSPSGRPGVYVRVTWVRSTRARWVGGVFGRPWVSAYEYGRKEKDGWKTWSEAEELKFRAEAKEQPGSKRK